LSSEEKVCRVGKVLETFPISAGSAKIALELISNYQIVQNYSEAVCKERAILVSMLRSLNIEVIDSSTNSIHFEVPESKYSLFLKILNEFDVLAKFGSGIGTPVKIPGSSSPYWVRFSISPEITKTNFFYELTRLLK
jgi:histidinol-phosphate/aromatic aminotransferase/cobyric acid decarboxylase-like protein